MQERTTDDHIRRTAISGKLSITAIVLTFNEEIHIERCLTRIMPLVERVVVVDSFSTDRTAEIAHAFGVEVLQHAWKNYSDQFQWALDNARPVTDWVLRLDADEYLEDACQAELRRRLAGLPADVTGLQLRLKVIFRGRWIRHGRYYSTLLLRLWRSGVGQIEQRWMDEHIVLAHGRTERIGGGDLVDHNLNDIGWWTEKHNRYATRHMVDHVNREFALFTEDERIRDTDGAARTRRFLKNAIYGRAPIYLRALLFYLYRYIVRLGFLDGRQGFVFHFLHGFWMMVLIDAKIDEARSFIRQHGVEAFRQHLRTHHGITV
jgi:glycosyltransferase involved in cell wall biosynthesis